MRKTNYISPKIALLDLNIERGFGASSDSSNVNIGIGGWDIEDEEFN